ncbi:TPR-like protein [Lizonia empirigonia]|nr:TPR-like protein [Lizonia empirigonia]
MPTAHGDTNASGLTFWSGAPTPDAPHDVDIVAVQGLGAHPFYTWVRKVPAQDAKQKTKGKTRVKMFSRLFRKKGRSPDDHGGCTTTEVMWPRDLLAPAFSNARVATYSYGSDWRDRQVNTSLRECGQQMLEVLLQHRQSASEQQRPLVLIGHSLGGLVIQQALAIAVYGPRYTDLRLSIAGIVFLGTPFQGSGEAAYAQWLAKLIRLQEAEGHRYTLLKTLQKDSPSLHALSIDFWRSYGEYDMTCFYENREAEYGPVSRQHKQFVSTQSATLVGQKLMYMDADHSGLNKFSSIDDRNFMLLLPELQRMVKDSASVVADRHRSKDASPAGNVHWMVPRAVNSLFTGRSEVVERMQSALRNNGPDVTKQTRVVITGIGGMGKSEVCLKVAELVREDFWGVFWVDVGSESTAKNDFLAVAKALGSAAESVDEARGALANTKKRWLLVLDNADGVDFDYACYIPSGAQGAVIVTSRNPQCSQYSTVPAEALKGLDAEHSTQLLLKAARVPEEAWQSRETQAQVQEVVRLLGSHTLALIQAGAYVAEGFCQLAEYPSRYCQHRKRLLEHHPEQEQSRYRDVYATFEASADALERSGRQDGRDALNLLAVLCMLHSGVLPLEVFDDAWRGACRLLKDVLAETDGRDKPDKMGDLGRWHVVQLPKFVDTEADEWDDYRLKKASARLVSLSLVTRNALGEGSSGLSMHPLAHAWAKDRLEKERQRQAWATAGCVLALSHGQTNLWQVRERELRPHVQSLLSPSVQTMLSCGPQIAVLAVLLQCGWTLNTMREDARLEQLLSDICQALHIRPSDPTTEHVPIWELAARNLGYMGHAREAVKLLEHVVKIRETTLDERHPDRLASQHVLAGAYRANGQTREAVELLEHVVKIRETTLDERHPSRLASQHELAGAYGANGQTREAVELLEHVVKIQETTLDERHPDRLASQHELAGAYRANGQTREAVELLEHVVKIEETTLDERHPSRLASQHALAIAYGANGQTREAVELLEHVVKIQETTLDERHPSRLASQHELAGAYGANGQTREAVELLEHVVKIEETTLDERHPSRLASQHALAIAYGANGQTREAVELLEHVVKIKETTLDERHPSRLASQHELAGAYGANGQTREAVELLEHVVKIRETTLDERHPDRLASQHELAGAYRANGQTREAVELLEHVVKIEETTLDERHPSRLASQHALAIAYGANGQTREAVELLEHVVKIRETTLDERHPSRLASQHVLAGAYRANGQTREAVELLEHVVKIRETTLDERHPDRLASQHELAASPVSAGVAACACYCIRSQRADKRGSGAAGARRQDPRDYAGRASPVSAGVAARACRCISG